MAKAANELRHQAGRMERKHILMPSSLIRCVDAMADEANVALRRSYVGRYGAITRR
ncbi:MAG TPA: hypothetical protein VKB96_05855 [Gammaproteobacteria bacterium]|nr:hypothetical protein [Gammaproteobacteria bacterium]